MARCKARLTEVFTEVFPLAIQNRVDEYRPVLKRFVSECCSSSLNRSRSGFHLSSGLSNRIVIDDARKKQTV